MTIENELFEEVEVEEILSEDREYREWLDEIHANDAEQSDPNRDTPTTRLMGIKS